MFIAFLQKYIDPKLVLNQGASGVHSTLGNPIYVGGYGMFIIFLGLLLYTKDSTASKYWRYFYLFGAFSGLFGIYAAGQRGPFLGLAAGSVITIYVYAWIYEEKKNVRNLAVYGTVVGLILLGTLVYFRKTNFVRNIPIVGSTVNISPDKGTLETRLIAWDIAIKSWKDRPIFGWGPRNFYYAFNQYYNPEILSHGYGETWFDNAHNILMETISTRGTFGFITYMALFIFAFMAIIKGYRRGDINVHEAALASGFLVGHFAHNLLVFEDPTSYLYFLFALAYLNQRVSRGNKESSETKTNRGATRASYGLTATVTAISVLLVYTTNVNPAKANMKSLDTLRSIKSGKESMQTYEKNLAIPSPHKDVIVSDVSQSVLQSLPKYQKAEKMNLIKPLFNKTLEDLEDIAELHPRDIRVHMKIHRYYNQKAALEKDKKYLEQAEKALNKALKYSPERQQLKFMMANLKLRLGKTEQAEKLLLSARDSDRDINKPWWRLALFYQKTNKPNKAKNTIIKAKREGIEFSGRGKKILNQIGLNPDNISSTDKIVTTSKKEQMKMDLKQQIQKQIQQQQEQQNE
jgi:tetratricopeptide (TPR) repeat protein